MSRRIRVPFTGHTVESEVADFWVVTRPTAASELIDVCFKTNIVDFMLQARGGLAPDDVLLVTRSRAKAERRAEAALASRGRGDAALRR